MTTSPSPDPTAGELARFPSLPALRTAHAELLQRRRLGEDTPESPAAVRAFIRQGRATGAILDDEAERQAAQSLLDFWANRLVRSDLETPDATLAEFDPSLAPELPDDPFHLSELIERLIEGQPAFDDRLRKQLGRAHELCCKRPLNSRTSECYDLCLTTLDMLSKSGVMGFEWHFMRGAVQLCMGMDYAIAGSLAEAGEHFKDSQESFRDGESPDGEALAYVGLAQWYDRK